MHTHIQANPFFCNFWPISIKFLYGTFKGDICLSILHEKYSLMCLLFDCDFSGNYLHKTIGVAAKGPGLKTQPKNCTIVAKLEKCKGGRTSEPKRGHLKQSRIFFVTGNFKSVYSGSLYNPYNIIHSTIDVDCLCMLTCKI